MSEFVVAKYGGTSMAQPEVVAGVVRDNPEQRVIVVSAPGATDLSPVRMTTQLERLAVFAEHNDLHLADKMAEEVINRFHDLYPGADASFRARMDELIAHRLDDAKNRSMADIKSVGEYASGLYFANLINGTFVEPTWVRFSEEGQLVREQTQIPKEMLDNTDTKPLVIPGYYGYDVAGNRHLLGNGGSDRTGALAAVSLGRVFGDQNVMYENWTDVDGIFTCDPRMVPTAHVIPELTRAEVREGAHGGSGVLQGDTIVDLNGSDIVTVVKNTKRPTAPGTRILNQRDTSQSSAVAALAGRDDLVEVTIKDLGMADQPGYVATLLENLGEKGLSIEHMPSSQDTFSITLHDDGKNRASIEEFADFARATRLSSQGTVDVSERGVVYLVGERLRAPTETRATLLRVLGTSATHDIDVYDVVSNSSSPCVALLTDRPSVVPLLDLIHSHEIERKNSLWKMH